MVSCKSKKRWEWERVCKERDKEGEKASARCCTREEREREREGGGGSRLVVVRRGCRSSDRAGASAEQRWLKDEDDPAPTPRKGGERPNSR